MNDRPIIKKANSGFVGHDGNGMVGGSWANTEILARKHVDVSRLAESVADEEKSAKCLEWLTEKIGESFLLEAYFDCGYDHSVGISSYCDLNEWLDPDEEVTDAIESCPWLTPDEKVAMLGYLYDICADEEGYELYDIDE